MAGRIPHEFIDDLLARVDLVDLIGTFVALKKSGANFVARCPFHSEKTPSFSVSREKQFYHCFGCGAHGNAIRFLMDYQHLAFPEAVETLAASVGLDTPRAGFEATRQSTPSLEAIYEIQGRAAAFYARQLVEHPNAAAAISYLKARGITGEMARRYQIGYAPPGWRNLPADWSQELLIRSGLMTERNGLAYDRFRNRILFPIRDRRGRVVGFGGRTLGDVNPKYLNSPETDSFKKSKEVYGLYEVLQRESRPRRIVVVEGYLDVIALAQHGIPEVVATLGTSISSDHVHLLFRFTSELIFCFDGDVAGSKAAWRALEASLPVLREGRQVRFLELPEGEDPDSLIRSEGSADFEKRIERAKPFSDYLFQRLSVGLNLRSVEGLASLQEQAQAVLKRLPAGIFRDLMMQRLEAVTGFATGSRQGTHALKPSSGKVPRQGLPSLWRELVIRLLLHPEWASRMQADQREALVQNPYVGSLMRRLCEYADRHAEPTTGRLIEYLRGTAEGELAEKFLTRSLPMVPEEGMEKEFQDALMRIVARSREERLDALIQKSKIASLTEEEREELRTLTRGRS